MFDQTNQARKKRLSHEKTTRKDELPERLFDDPDPRDAEQTLDAQTPVQATADKVPEGLLPFHLFEEDARDEAKPADAQTVPIKYNGEVIELPLDEAITLAQKGMNYDHMLSERERESAALAKLAAAAGLSRAEYLSQFEERGAGVDPQEAAWRRLLSGYPEAAERELPAEFFQQVDSGKNPVELYQQMLIDDLKERLAVAQKNAENRVRVPGSARGDAQERVRDAFLEGFLGL